MPAKIHRAQTKIAYEHTMSAQTFMGYCHCLPPSFHSNSEILIISPPDISVPPGVNSRSRVFAELSQNRFNSNAEITQPMPGVCGKIGMRGGVRPHAYLFCRYFFFVLKPEQIPGAVRLGKFYGMLGNRNKSTTIDQEVRAA
jgi:hypothetical protein